MDVRVKAMQLGIDVEDTDTDADLAVLIEHDAVLTLAHALVEHAERGDDADVLIVARAIVARLESASGVSLVPTTRQ
ncbi:MAG: hypothetical protein R3D68_07060 [Hyphomicrobiaceae bacterium]